MRTVSKKVLSLLLVAVLVLSAIPFAAFADGLSECPVDSAHTLTHVAAKDASCTEDGVLEHWHCAGCNKDYNASGDEMLSTVGGAALGHISPLQDVAAVGANCVTGQTGNKAHKKCTRCNSLFDTDGTTPLTLADVTIPANHNKVRTGAVAPKCATGEAGTEAYDKCSNCNKYFDVDTGNEIAAPVSVPASHTDANNDGTCDVCNTSIKCTISFEIKRIKIDGTVETVPLASNTIAVKQGEKMGDPVVAPACPRGYAYDRLNGSVWTMVEKNGSPVTNGGSYSKNNVVTVDMKTVTYRAIQREQTVNLTVAFRKGNTEYTYCTINNIPYSKTVDANGNAISVYEYITTHDVHGNSATGAASIKGSFDAAFISKSITTNNGGIVDVTGFTWTNDQKFLSAATNNPINDGALKLNINLGIANPDVKVYANLKEQTSFEITFSPMSPYDSTASVQGNFGKKTVTLNSVLSNLPTPTCTGYVFMGWYDEPMKGAMSYANGIVTLDGQNAGAKHYVNGTQYTTRGNITLYPYWIKEVDAWVVVHNSKDATVSSMAKIQGVKPTDSIAKTTVLANVQGYTANNFIGPIMSHSATGFNSWTDAPMGASVATNATESFYFHIYSPSAKAVSVTPGANSGANGTTPSGSSSAPVDPSNPKTGDAQRVQLNVATVALAVATVALGTMTTVMFVRRKQEV